MFLAIKKTIIFHMLTLGLVHMDMILCFSFSLVTVLCGRFLFMSRHSINEMRNRWVFY